MQKSSQIPLVGIHNLDDIDEVFKGLPGIRDSTNNSDEIKKYPENNTLMELTLTNYKQPRDKVGNFDLLTYDKYGICYLNYDKIYLQLNDLEKAIKDNNILQLWIFKSTTDYQPLKN